MSLSKGVIKTTGASIEEIFPLKVLGNVRYADVLNMRAKTVHPPYVNDVDINVTDTKKGHRFLFFTFESFSP